MRTPASPGPGTVLPGSIEHLVVTDVPVCSPESTVAELTRMIIGTAYESAVDVAVCVPAPGGSQLVGLIPLPTVLAADPYVRAGDLMDPDPPVVGPGTSQEQGAWKAAHHGESSLAVVDAQGRFRGLVPAARMLMVLLAEHDEDLARLGGFLRSAESARHAMDEPVAARLWHRLPWLLIGLVGSALAAVLVREFEPSLEADVRLAFFIPGIVYMADAVGTQTEALVIRGLSVGVRLRRVVRLETLTGLFVGLVLGGAALPVVALVMGSWALGLTVALALLSACGVATVVAMGLPWAMSALGRDPAFGSGPLATVLQDLLSLLLYFGIAAAILL